MRDPPKVPMLQGMTTIASTGLEPLANGACMLLIAVRSRRRGAAVRPAIPRRNDLRHNG